MRKKNIKIPVPTIIVVVSAIRESESVFALKPFHEKMNVKFIKIEVFS